MAVGQITVSEIFNEQIKLDQNQSLKVATIISGDPNFNRPPDYWINIFNISHLEFVRHRPVDFPTIRIAACPEGEPWVLAVRVPNIINYKWVSPETGQPSFSSQRGERFATDLVNPANLGEDIWAESSNSDYDSMHGGSDDLSRRGVFWSKNAIPSDKELRTIKGRLERHYRECVQRADALFRDPKTMGSIGEEPHIAAEYLGISNAWHFRSEVPVSCPNCGEPIKPGVSFHQSTMGLCVLDWRGAIQAGIRKREDVPMDMRWWSDDTEAPKGRKN